jgi:excisionase family DNA binding protein
MDSAAEIQHHDGKVEPWMTVCDVAAYLQISPENVRKKARDGELPAKKLGRVWRFRRREIDRYLSNHE